MLDVTQKQHQQLSGLFRSNLSVFQDAEDLINIGAYVAGSNPEIDQAIRLMPNLRAFLQQGLYEMTPYEKIEMLMEAALQG